MASSHRSASAFLIGVASLLALAPAPTRAFVISTFVDGAFNASPPASNTAGQYDFATVTIFVNPANIAWIAWNNTSTLTLPNGGCAGGFCLGPGGFGGDDFIRLTVTNPQGASLTADLDRNTAFGNSTGPQNVIFGTASAAPDAIRTSPSFGSPPSVTTIFNEAGTHSAIFTTPGDYRFDFSFQNEFAGGAGHSNVFLLRDANGIYGATGPSVPIGGDPGLTVSLDPGQVLADPVLADPCAEMSQTGATLGLNAQSLGGTPRDTKNCTVNRSFYFTGPGTSPTLAHLYGGLEGRLIADNQGDASVQADLFLYNANHVLLGEAHYSQFADSNLRQLVDWNIFETLQIDAMLTPGELYELSSHLRVSAFGGALGAGRALFGDTLEVAISGAADNPFADPQRQTTVTITDLNAVPEPASAALVLLGMGLLGLRPTRRRMSR